MRKIGRLSLAGVLLISILSISPVSHAAKNPVAGAKCTKANATVIFKGKLFTCVKSEGKQVWNKGVRIRTATPSPIPTASATTSPTPIPSQTQVLYTLERVRANNSSSSCWTIIDGYVYDLTSWISAHPGGPGVIRSMCGTDGTNAFKAQHQNQMSPAQRLNGYLLGPLSR